jgi:hypothetical protein
MRIIADMNKNTDKSLGLLEESNKEKLQQVIDM